MANNFFLVRFSEEKDYQRALFEGPWKIFDYYITVARWTPEFNEEAPIQKIMTCVRLPKPPIQYFNRLAFERIGNHIGRTIRLDLATAEGARARYARVCVEVDLSQPLLGKYVIEDRVFLVEYESLDNICFSCGLYGHKEEGCRPAVSNEEVTPPTNKIVKEKLSSTDGNSGSWMTVKRCHQKSTKSPEPSSKSNQNHGSRFKILGDDVVQDEAIDPEAELRSNQTNGVNSDPSQMEKSLQAVLDKALNTKIGSSAAASKGKTSKSVQIPFSDVTNLPTKKKVNVTKRRLNQLTLPMALF
ncbi:hypothetical protein LINPERHAP2_LOCUS3799 [Linum perenne]